MDEKAIESVEMSDGSVTAFEERMDNLLNTMDIELCLDTLPALRDGYLIILSVKDTP